VYALFLKKEVVVHNKALIYSDQLFLSNASWVQVSKNYFRDLHLGSDLFVDLPSKGFGLPDRKRELLIISSVMLKLAWFCSHRNPLFRKF
jgi:hypothetical protein